MSSPAGPVDAGMRAHVDPATGEFIPPPPGVAAPPPAARAPVRQEFVPGRGVRVDTRELLLHSVTGTAEPSGETKIGCTQASQAPGQ
jgi:hypothetical protein